MFISSCSKYNMSNQFKEDNLFQLNEWRRFTFMAEAKCSQDHNWTETGFILVGEYKKIATNWTLLAPSYVFRARRLMEIRFGQVQSKTCVGVLGPPSRFLSCFVSCTLATKIW